MSLIAHMFYLKNHPTHPSMSHRLSTQPATTLPFNINICKNLLLIINYIIMNFWKVYPYGSGIKASNVYLKDSKICTLTSDNQVIVGHNKRQFAWQKAAINHINKLWK
jgi:hypothetical protein